MKLNSLKKGLALGVLVGAFTLASTATSEAAFVAWICNDAACAGGDDLSFTDDDNDGLIVGVGAAGNLEVVVNTAQSKPLLTSGMDLTYTVTNAAGAGGTVWLYAADTDFDGPATLNGSIGGTSDNGSVVAYICGGTDNSGPSPINSGCVDSGVLTPGAGDLIAGTVGPLFASADPYSLAIGVAVTLLEGNGTATGDLRVNVPEPATLALFGLGLSGLAMYRRRRMQQVQ